MEFVDDLDGKMHDSLPCVSFKIVKWPMPLDWAINILPYCIKMELIGKIGMQLCENISTLPCVRSISGRSESIWW